MKNSASEPKGKDQSAAKRCRRAHPVGHADSQNALHESFGVREMSLITTPPLRRPIKTHLASQIRRFSIRQELDRGAGVYVVPRVEESRRWLRAFGTCFRLKLLVAHGQMAEGELESAMVAFNAGEADDALQHQESGLDIPRVNTILIEDAHRFGLAQLTNWGTSAAVHSGPCLMVLSGQRIAERHRASAAAPFRNLPNWAVAISSRCGIWKSGESAPVCSRAAKWKPSASTSTWKCCRNHWPKSRSRHPQRR